MFSCNNIEKPKKPDNLISKDRMVDVITDISLMTAAKGMNKNLLEKNMSFHKHPNDKKLLDPLAWIIDWITYVLI